MNKLLEILKDAIINEKDDYSEDIVVNSKEIMEVCGGKWIYLREKPYWMEKDIVLENNGEFEARILPWELQTASRIGEEIMNLPKAIMGPRQVWKKEHLETMLEWQERIGNWEEFLPFRNRFSWLRDSLNRYGWKEEWNHNGVEIYMYFQHKDDEGYGIENWYDPTHEFENITDDVKRDYLVTYNADFIIHNGNHRIAIMNYDGLDIDVPVRLEGMRYNPNEDDEYLNNEIFRRPMSFKVKNKKTKPVIANVKVNI